MSFFPLVSASAFPPQRKLPRVHPPHPDPGVPTGLFRPVRPEPRRARTPHALRWASRPRPHRKSGPRSPGCGAWRAGCEPGGLCLRPGGTWSSSRSLWPRLLTGTHSNLTPASRVRACHFEVSPLCQAGTPGIPTGHKLGSCPGPEPGCASRRLGAEPEPGTSGAVSRWPALLSSPGGAVGGLGASLTARSFRGSPGVLLL